MTAFGMNSNTGKALDSAGSIAQSVNTILTTPVGSMPWLRTFGSLLYALIDQPGNLAVSALIRAATVIALQRWEPRIKVTRVAYIPPGAGGGASLTIEADPVDGSTATPLSLSIQLS